LSNLGKYELKDTVVGVVCEVNDFVWIVSKHVACFATRAEGDFKVSNPMLESASSEDRVVMMFQWPHVEIVCMSHERGGE
jgi:hypothetical protein